MKSSKIVFSSGVLALSLALTVSACSDPGADPTPSPTITPSPTPSGQPRALVAPSTQALQAAEELQAIPGVTISFSQVHGYPLEVHRFPTADRESDTPLPLEVSHGAFAAGRASALIKFLSLHPAAFGLASSASGAKSELKLTIDKTNPELNENDQDPNPSGVFSTRVDQYIGGYRVLGRHALGHFDPRGNLYSVVTRLLPVDRKSLPLQPAFSASELAKYADPVLSELARRPELRWLQGATLASLQSSSELVLMPEQEAPGAKLALVYRLQLRVAASVSQLPQEAIVYLDALTGELKRAHDNTPTDWHNDAAALLTVTALDETNTSRNILACRQAGNLLMGFGSNYVTGAVRPFNAGQWFTLMDAADPIANWTTPFQQAAPASAFTLTGTKRQLTSANLNTRAMLDWWAARGWRSWDGRGAAIGFFVNGRPNEDGSPSYNAWGGGGYITTGGAGNAAGQTFASDIEVLGHEFMHNVIGATSGLTYDYESGALNEALADLFGVALTVNSATDRLADSIVGTTFGIRDMQTPGNGGQPDRYSAFVETEGDSRGVHTNSGIMNKAHWLMIQGGTFNGVRIAPLGAEKVFKLILNVNRFGRLDTDTGLEEFAATVIGRCRLAAFFATILGTPAALRTDCSSIERAYRSVELLGFAPRADLVVDSAETIGQVARLQVRNGSSEPFNLSEYTWEVLDGSTVIDTLPLEERPQFAGSRHASISFYGDPDRVEGTRTWIAPGGRAQIESLIALDLLGESVLRTPRSLSIRLRRSSGGTDINIWNNQIPVRFSSELNGMEGMPTAALGGQQARLRVAHHARGMTQIAPITSVLLTRTTANGPFTAVAGSEQTLPTAIRTQDSLRTTGEVTGRVYFPEILLNQPWTTTPPNIILDDIVSARYSPYGYYLREVWFNATGGRPELEGRTQYYLLTDALNVVTEDDEGDNLTCLNCAKPSDSASFPKSSIVRFPRTTTNIESLFPARYRAAAAELRSLREGELRDIAETVGRAGLDYRR